MLSQISLSRSWIAVLALALFLSTSAPAQEQPNPIVAQIKAELKDPSQPFTVLVHLQVKEGEQKKLEAAFAKAIPITRKEKGVLAYDLNRDTKDATRYVVYERWKSLADLEAHLRAPHITALLGQVKDMLAGAPEAKVLLPAGE
jgi:quinol monooxygenase YgiN